MGPRSDFSKPCQGAAEKSANATRRCCFVRGSQPVGMSTVDAVAAVFRQGVLFFIRKPSSIYPIPYTKFVHYHDFALRILLFQAGSFMMAMFECPAKRRKTESMSRFEYTIENVLDVPLWEKMQDRLAELTGTAIICIDIKGKPVTKHSGRTEFCSIVRENPVSRKRCFRCDALAGVEAVRRGRPYIYLCHCGVVDVAVPVMVGDIYLGAVMFGQVRLRHKDREKAERLVNEIGSILPQEDTARQDILRKYELLPEMDYDRIVLIAEYIDDMVHYIVDRAVKSHTRDETYKWLMSASAEQPSEEIAIQEILPQEERRLRQTGALPVKPSSVVYPAVVYIRDHLRQEITMKEMADLCHLSPSYFSRTFNKETGESFVNYISSRRIQQAKELLQETGKSITQIADEVGYDNISHFTAVFKRTEGITPSAYRASKKRKKFL